MEHSTANIEELKNKLHFLAYKYFYKFKPFKIFSYIFNRGDIANLRYMSRNKDIIICKPDKGSGVVIIDKCAYVNKMKEF